MLAVVSPKKASKDHRNTQVLKGGGLQTKNEEEIKEAETNRNLGLSDPNPATNNILNYLSSLNDNISYFNYTSSIQINYLAWLLTAGVSSASLVTSHPLHKYGSKWTKSSIPPTT